MARPGKKALLSVVKVVKAMVFLVVLALAVISILTILPINFPLKPYVVLTGSMSPTIPAGSVSFVNRSATDIGKGDVITFIRPDDFSQNVTHRVVSEERDGNQVYYKTKGDANEDPDSWQVKRESVWGKVAFSLPFVGFAVNFARTRVGVILLVVLPLALIALDEMRVTHREVKKIRQNRREKRAAKGMEAMSAEAAKKAAMILLIAGFTLISTNIGSTLALFTDSVSVTNNVVATGYWVPPSVTLISPNGGQTLYQGNNYSIQWIATSGILTSVTTIDLSYTTDGINFVPIAVNEPNDGIYLWSVPYEFANAVTVRVAVTDTPGISSYDDSDSTIAFDSPIVLNEFLPDPIGADNAVKPFGEWVELKNNGSVPVDADGWYIYDEDFSDIVVSTTNSDGNGDPTDSGETVIPAGGYLVVYRNGDVDFELDEVGGDSLALYDGPIATANLIDSYTYVDDVPVNKSYARVPDGTGPFIDPIPTPGRPNVLGEEIYQEVLVPASLEVTATPAVSSSPTPTPSPTSSATPTFSPTPSPTPVTPLVFPEPTFIPELPKVDIIIPVEEGLNA